ncbi:class I adenylate-forming enzyme family protein [Alteribacillus sp. YIM 98480]|uniref:class I adenylate-forming enzyme family protein n=1 Tax=Alteribacillus sp. YIM 98480 TaxID=2606599 RepID=UPI00131C8691|nr:AMP-binding protein [Alteribacillus sp. YIM 98480]
MHLTDLFESTVNRAPNQNAIFQGEKSYTYSQINEKANRAASSMQRLGVGKQDRVMVLLKNRIENIIMFWAIQKIGAIYVPINLRMSLEYIQYCINDVEAKMIVFEESSRYLLKQEHFKHKPIIVSLQGMADLSYDELVKNNSLSFHIPRKNAEDLSTILYTSGTSGKPKGVPRSHKNEYTSTMSHIIQNRYVVHDSTLGAVPLYHTMGLRSLLSMSILDGECHTMLDFDPVEALEIISKQNISCLYLMPTMYHDLVHCSRTKNIDFSSVRVLTFAGSPMSKELIEKCNEMFQPQHLVNHYGSTEIYTFTTSTNVRNKPWSAGKPGIHQNVRLVAIDSKGKSDPSKVVKEGEVGEIIVNTNSAEAFKGYWNRPDATNQAINDGWYYTGDMGKRDEEGDLTVVGRVDEMILSNGENIHPQEIETILSNHPLVKESAVIGENDERFGQLVVAFIVPENSNVTVQQLDQYCKESPRLSNYTRPRKYIFISELPLNNSGKIDRQGLVQGCYAEI